METTTKKRKNNSSSATAKVTSIKVVEQGEQLIIPIELIDLSPLNYRKHYNQQALTEFADQLKVHGVLQNVTVRKIGERYELVAGERRFRAAEIAGIQTLPAIVKVLTDEQVIEIQLAENIQRENPHPMHEAQAMAQLLNFGKDYEEIGKKLGRSKAIIFRRLQLNELLPEIQDLFMADKIALKLANEIAEFGKPEQAEIFEVLKNDPNSYMIRDTLNRLQANLLKAPFNIEDEKLLKGVSSCVDCPFNSASLASLFPEMENKAFCKSKQCFSNKCDAHFNKLVQDAISNFDYSAILSNYNANSTLLRTLKEHSESKDKLILDFYRVKLFFEEEPRKEDFNLADGDEVMIDEESYQEAIEDFKEECERLELLKKSGKANLCLFVKDDMIHQAYFAESDSLPIQKEEQISAKEVQNAIKDGTVTVELLLQEIDRLESREKRSKELDSEKIYLEIHTRFQEHNTELSNVDQLTKADIVGSRLLVYNSLDYWAKRKVDETLDSGKRPDFLNADLYEIFEKMTDKQFCHMIRLGVSTQSGSKLPNTVEGKIMYRVAQDSGIDIATIEKDQNAIALEREARKNERVEEVRKQMGKTDTQEKAA